MADLKTEAALAAGKDMAKRALDQLTMSDEEKEEKKGDRKKTLIKYGAIGLFGLVLVLSLMSVLAKFWVYAFGLLVVAGVGAGGYFYLRPKVRALKDKATARLNAGKAEREAEAQEKAVVDAAAAKQKKLEDELEALRKKAH